MARKARMKAEYLHIIVRGIGKQLLFEENNDRMHYLDLIQRYSDDVDLTIVAYCLMENHVHLLVYDPNMQIAIFMKKLGISYAQYFNRKYERTGHLFQDRYKSEAVLDEYYLLTVFRYILNNPAKAGICATGDYKWSSYNEYGKKGALTDTSLLQEIIGNKKKLDEFLAVNDDIECMEYQHKKHDDEWALDIIHNQIGLSSGTELQKMARKERNQMLSQLKEKGLTIRQIERLTGINRGVIQKAKRDGSD